MSRMALAVFPVSFREWTNTSTYGETSQETQSETWILQLLPRRRAPALRSHGLEEETTAGVQTGSKP